MDIDFPSNPSIDDTYEDPTGAVWIFNGQSWEKTFKNVYKITTGLKDNSDVGIGDVLLDNGKFLIYDSGQWNYITYWKDMPASTRFSAYRNSGWTVSEGSDILVPFDTLRYTNSNYNTSTYKFTIPTTGYWHISSKMFIYEIRETCIMKLYKNGSLDEVIFEGENYASPIYSEMIGNTLKHFTAGDELQIYIYLDGYIPVFKNGIYYNEFSGVFVQ